jgi:hypothetical protein
VEVATTKLLEQKAKMLLQVLPDVTKDVTLLLLEQKLERCCEFASAKDAAIFLL